MVLVILLSLTLVIWILATIDALIGFRKLDSLEKAGGADQEPLLSVIVAARNEEENITQSVRTQLAQTYKNTEWILVNDRSEDGTGNVMENLKGTDTRIQVIHIESLPEGWLGKNHALYKGFQLASGRLILFTDADVMYHPEAFSRAVGYFEEHSLDHLTAAPNLSAKPFWLKAFVAFFLFGFSYYKRPWLGNNPRAKTGVGIGAFNMMTRSAYEKVGTHEYIKMRPDDDLQLGMMVKRQGLKQRIVTAMTLIEVEWYQTLGEALGGLEKNTFAGLHYRISMVLFSVFGVFVSQVLPFFTVFSGNQSVAILSAVNLAFLAVLYVMVTKKMTQFSPWLFLVLPFTALLFIFSILRASYLTMKRGGIIWRGTKYTLAELRKNTLR
ncbi:MULTISPECIES: glycosyltransferase family 2 protein [unclassified Mesobacillus]|uniref:glycosyltransferase n=1 Tax=unclassified Mesobacillus TaxID=2675270 RepID=UPI002041DD3E|nr:MULTISPECIES: glycosyltransferase family 2 protein [unclassified Mesobacillus]MCM3122300.1 glycosyltransferase [Mesobacillus sp. MER 33]MCM3232264.1 glycosyltransferase [Mesobacillus sp. MER 48]